MSVHPLEVMVAIVAITPTIATAAKDYSAKKHSAFTKALRMPASSVENSRHIAENQTPTLETFASEIAADTNHARALRKRDLEKAKPVVPDKRLLQNYNNNDGSDAQTDDGADEESTNIFGFEPTQYSISYRRCSKARQFDDQLAAQEDSTSVFTTKRFAVFRLCPTNSCEQNPGNYNEGGSGSLYERFRFDGANGQGCRSHYGEYMLELEDYLDLMVSYTILCMKSLKSQDTHND